MTNKIANIARGEVGVTVGGEKYVMALTVGALAALEGEFGVYEEMASAFKRPSLTSVLTFLKTVAATNADDGGGELVPVSRMRADEAMTAFGGLMESIMRDNIDVVEKPKANRQTRRAAKSTKTI